MCLDGRQLQNCLLDHAWAVLAVLTPPDFKIETSRKRSLSDENSGTMCVFCQMPFHPSNTRPLPHIVVHDLSYLQSHVP